MEDFYPTKNHGPDSGIGSDNGDKRLSTTEVSIQTADTPSQEHRVCETSMHVEPAHTVQTRDFISLLL